MDENEDIRMVKKRLLVDTIRDEGRVCGEILAFAFVDVGKSCLQKKGKSHATVSVVSLTQESINIFLINFYRQF